MHVNTLAQFGCLALAMPLCSIMRCSRLVALLKPNNLRITPCECCKAPALWQHSGALRGAARCS